MGDYNQVIIGPDNTLLHAWGDNRNDPNGNNPDVFFIQTRSTDPLGNSELCECDKNHEHGKDDCNNKNKIENKFNPTAIFAPQITAKCKEKECCDYHHRRKDCKCRDKGYEEIDCWDWDWDYNYD